MKVWELVVEKYFLGELLLRASDFENRMPLAIYYRKYFCKTNQTSLFTIPILWEYIKLEPILHCPNRFICTPHREMIRMWMKSINQDTKQVTIAKSTLAKAAYLNPVEGTDVNVVTMAQMIVNKTVSGVVVKIVSSSNSQVAVNGTITYGNQAVTGKVIFSLSKGKATNTQQMTVVVPKTNVVVPAPTPDPIPQVNVKNYGAQGDGISDDTAAIQKAIDYGSSNAIGTVYIPDGIYVINPDVSVRLRSNIKLTLASNATLKAKPTSSGGYNIILIQNVTNISIVGGSIIGERDAHLGTTGDHGMGIGIYDSSYVTITDISIRNCWGDGIYLGTNTKSGFNSNIDIERFKCDNNRRIGLTVISAKNLIIKDGVCSNSNDTLPMAGIDLEPNYSTQFLQNILIENLKTINNGGYGLDFWLGNDSFDVPISSVSLIIKNCTDSGSSYGTMHDISKYISKGYNITVF
jgi:Endopolygalacturonase